jgi:hypothetical protein
VVLRETSAVAIYTAVRQHNASMLHILWRLKQ